MLTMLMMGADDDADDRENYISKLRNSRSTAPRAPNISSLRELGPVSTHDVLCSWRGVWVETKGHERRFRKLICKNAPSCACSDAPPNRCFCNGIHGRNFMLAKKCHF